MRTVLQSLQQGTYKSVFILRREVVKKKEKKHVPTASIHAALKELNLLN